VQEAVSVTGAPSKLPGGTRGGQSRSNFSSRRRGGRATTNHAAGVASPTPRRPLTPCGPPYPRRGRCSARRTRQRCGTCAHEQESKIGPQAGPPSLPTLRPRPAGARFELQRRGKPPPGLLEAKQLAGAEGAHRGCGLGLGRRPATLVAVVCGALGHRARVSAPVGHASGLAEEAGRLRQGLRAKVEGWG
jgi:hypothetical protein